MELVHTHQVPLDELNNEDIDVLIVTYNTQCSVNSIQASLLSRARRKVILNFSDSTEITDKFSNDFEIINMTDGADGIIQILSMLCEEQHSDVIKMVIDYSYMNKAILAEIVNYLSNTESGCEKITVYFCYSGDYDEIIDQSHTNLIQPILLHDNYKFNNRPVSLIVELTDYQQLDQMDVLTNSFFPQSVHYFISTEVKRPENYMFSGRKDGITVYNPDEMELLDTQLRHLCCQLRLTNRVIIISIASKVFSLVAFLINSRYPDVEVWEYDFPRNPVFKSIDGKTYIYKAVLSDDYLDE
jgi:hypothetical protein